MSTQPVATVAVEEATLQSLRAAVRGSVLTPNDPGYEEARKVHNGIIDKRPAVIVRCTGAADVIAAVRFARSQNLLVAIRGGSHNQAGLAVCDGGLVIDLSAMRAVRVDPTARIAYAQGGATWGDYDHETQAAGLASTGGLVSTTGIGGLTLGGGFGWLARKLGLVVDNLLSADVVTADGRLLTASETEHPDLFWALRGGGGNFGVVTSFQFRLHPLGLVLGGLVLHPAEKARDVLTFFRDYVAAAPDELFAFPAFITVPPMPVIPAHLHGTQAVAIAACYSGPHDEGEKVIQPLRAFGPPLVDLLGPMPYPALQSMFDAAAPAGARGYWKSDYFAELSDGAIDALVHAAAAMSHLSPLVTVHVYPFGGAIARVAPEATAFRYRNATFSTIIAGFWFDPAQDEAHRAWVRDLWQAMRPHSMGGTYVNFLGEEGADRVREAYGENYERLLAVKRTYDPTNFFRVNQNIAP